MRPPIALIAMLLVSVQAFATAPPSRYGVDAPELARLGPYAVGVRTLLLRQAAQADVLAFDPAHGTAPSRDRELGVDLWYPARPPLHAAPVVYMANLPSEPPAPPASFSVPGIAAREAAPAGGGFPLVVVSHGYSNDPAVMTWLTENLASKGYVVAAIRHDDPPITDRSKFVQPLLRRPLDIAYVTLRLQATLAEQRLIDPQRTALVGYSMGGYGVLTAAGASLDPKGPPTQMIPGGLLQPYVRGGALADSIKVKGLRAVVAISPSGGGTLAAWGPEGLHSISVPLLLIAGDRDHRQLCLGRTRVLRPSRQCSAISVDLQGRRALDRFEPGTRSDASAAVGRRLVRGSGVESGTRQRDQRAFHHRLPRSLRQGRRDARRVSGCTDCAVRGRRVAGGCCAGSIRCLQSCNTPCQRVERLPAQSRRRARTAGAAGGLPKRALRGMERRCIRQTQ